MPAPTILSLKQDFLVTQTRLLQTDPAPSTAWLNNHHTSLSQTRPYSPSSSNNNNNNNNNNNSNVPPLPPRVIDDALFRLTHILQQHSRRVHAPSATRHVAEQIDQLYWQAAERGGPEEETEGIPGRHENLSTPLAIESLAADFPLALSAEDAARYSILHGRLTELSSTRTVLVSRLQRLQRIRSALSPLSPVPSSKRTRTRDGNEKYGEDVEEEGEEVNAVQENLVTRNGEMEKELERMRVLLARVGGRVGRLRGVAGSEREEMGDVEAEERRKVDELLDEF